MCRRIIMLSLLLSLVLQYGCAKKIPISYDQIEKGNLVRIETKSKTSYSGLVKAKESDFVVLQTDRNQKSLNKVTRNNINSILITPPVYDYKKNVISEWEIEHNQGSKNTILYTVGGAGLSFGASFFIGSMLHRSISDAEYRNTALWTTTGVGSAIGTYLFARTGKNKDRQASIMDIRERRYAIAQKEANMHKKKQQKVRSELEKAKRDRKKQNLEIRRLQKRLNEQEKKKQEGEPN